MHLAYFSGALWFLSGLLAAQNTGTVAARNGAIQGIVAESATGRTLGSVEIWLEEAAPPRRDPLQPGPPEAETFPFVTLTDLGGRFLIEEIPPGEYRMFAGDGEALIQQEYGQRSPELPGTVIRVGAGQRLMLDFRLLTAGAISGHVLDDAGEPVAGIPVYAEILQFRLGKLVSLNLAQMRLGSARRVQSLTPEMGYSVTDEDGAYRLAGLPPGDYFVVVRYRAGEEARDGFATILERDAAVPVYYPDVLRVDDAEPVRIAGNEVSGVDVQWRPVEPVSVRGEVIGGEGEGQLRLNVSTIDGVPVPLLSLDPVVDPDGSFELLLPPFQSYLVTARRTRTTYVGMSRIDVSESNQEDISIVLLPPARITGQIVYAGAPVNIPLDLSRLRVRFQSGAEGYSGSQFSVTRVNPDGAFGYDVLRGLGYRLEVEGLPEGYYVESAVLEGRDILTDGLDLSVESPAASMTVRLSSGTGEISGTVVDASGTPYHGARVTLIPSGVYRNRYDRYKATFTDSDGRFRLESVPSGPYQVLAWENIPIDAEMNADFIAPFLGRGRSIRIDPTGASIESELRIIEVPPGLSVLR